MSLPQRCTQKMCCTTPLILFVSPYQCHCPADAGTSNSRKGDEAKGAFISVGPSSLSRGMLIYRAPYTWDGFSVRSALVSSERVSVTGEEDNREENKADEACSARECVVYRDQSRMRTT